MTRWRADCRPLRSALATVILLVGGTLAGEAAAQELRLAHFMSPQHPMSAGVMIPLAEEIAAATDGELSIRIFPGGELGSDPIQQYRRAVTGVADIAFGIPAYTPDQFPLTTLITFPGVARNAREGTEILWSVLDDHLAPEFERVRLLGIWTNNPAVLLTRNRPVRTLDDMRGLKVRAPDRNAARLLEGWGAVPVNIPVTETYNAMSTGVVDAVMIGPSALLSHRLEEVSEYVTVGLPSTVASFYLIMNHEAWERLDPDHQTVLEAATGRDLSLRASAAWDEAAEMAMQAMRDAGGTVITLTPEEAAAFQPDAERVRAALIAEMERGTGDAADVLELMATARE